MADRPIIFSAPMVRALLEGRKTQTRRLMPFQAELTQAYAPMVCGKRILNYAGEEIISDARYSIGDRLYVRECFSYREEIYSDRDILPTLEPRPWYWADGNIADGNCSKPKPSIHMPRWASRLTLTVTDVRVQRLQEISEEDARAEGVDHNINGGPDDRTAFCRLWNSLHGPDAWAANPWVVALTFTVERRNIDAHARAADSAEGPATAPARHGSGEVV